ncbi:FAD-dependent oxidoreductase [Paracoccaceae bacterium]|nr:FAD-dependent oxidoreductase [Paracoccaceae bacterium]
MQKENEHIIIVGAGIGGLVSALLLSHQGLKVTVIERNEHPGGKLRGIPSEEGPIDAGPTVLTLIDVFEDIFSNASLKLFEELDLYKEEILARHYWPDGKCLDLFSSHKKNLASIAKVFGEKSANEFNKFHRDCEALFFAFDKALLKNRTPISFYTKTDFLKSLPRLIGILGLPTDYWSKLESYFSEPKLRQLFGRYATYVGGSPFNSPSLLQLIWYVEFLGVWRIRGGLHNLADRLKQLSMKNGTEFIFGKVVEKINIKGNKVCSVDLNDGQTYKAGTVLFNGDPRSFREGYFGENFKNLIKKTATEPRSLSAYVWSFASATDGLNLAHHNVFFNDDYKNEFDSILAGQIAKDPTLYVCQQEEGLTSRSKNRFEIIINAPSLSQNKISVTKEYDLCKERTFQKLSKMGINFKNKPKLDDLTTPRSFDNLAPGADGSIYGLSPQRLFSTFQRPSAKTRIKGLYLTGGGVHPGPGLPMAALSGKHAAEMIKQDLALT